MEQQHVKHGRHPKSHMSRNNNYLKMKRTWLVMVIAATLLMTSCKNGELKVTNANDLINEFKENHITALAKYKGQTVEFVGTFGLNSNEDDATFYLLDSGIRINNGVRVVSNYNKDILKKNSLTPYIDEKYFYNENSKEIYTDEVMKQIAKSVLTNSDQTKNNTTDIYKYLTSVEGSIFNAMNCKNYPIDTLAYLQTKEIKIDKDGKGFFYPMDTTISTDYPDLKTIANDIKTNKIHRCDSLYEAVIDRVTLKGKIKEITFTKTNVGDDVMVIQLENSEITNKEKIFDFNKLPVLDYTAAQKAIQEKMKAVSLISPDWKYYKVNDPNGADLLNPVERGYPVIRKVMPSERFEITADGTTFWNVKFEDGTTGMIEKGKVAKYKQ